MSKSLKNKNIIRIVAKNCNRVYDSVNPIIKPPAPFLEKNYTIPQYPKFMPY
jgi:hypothetical protein